MLITVALERHATEIADRWRHADHVPVVQLIGTDFPPLAQWVLLPLLMIRPVRRRTPGQERLQSR